MKLDFGIDSIAGGTRHEMRICCPFCYQKTGREDTKYHCYVNLHKEAFNCFRCNSSGHLSRLKEFFSDVNVITKSVSLEKIRSRIDKLFIKKIRNIDLNMISIPLSPEKTPIAYGYISKRGFTDEEIDTYHLRVGMTYKDGDKDIKKWAGRILFPVVDSQGPIFLTGRSYVGQEPKYLHTEGSKDYIVYGSDRVKNRSAIICEGVISAIAAERKLGMSALAVYGKHATIAQATKIRSVCDNVFVCLDGTEDVTQSDRNKLNRSLIRSGLIVNEIRLPSGLDPDDISREEFLRCLDGAKRIKL